MVQLPTAREALVTVPLVLPAAGAKVAKHVLVALGGLATTKLTGNVSVKLASTAITFGLVTLKVSVEGALMATVVGLKLLVIWSGSRMMMPTLARPPVEGLANPAVVV